MYTYFIKTKQYRSKTIKIPFNVVHPAFNSSRTCPPAMWNISVAFLARCFSHKYQQEWNPCHPGVTLTTELKLMQKKNYIM